MENDTTEKGKEFPKLSSVLDALNLADHITVQSVYGAQYGQLVFSHKDFIKAEDSERPISEFEVLTEKYEEDESWRQIGKEFFSAISNHHNIFDLSSSDPEYFSVDNENYGRWFLDAEFPLTMSMKIPSSHKEFMWGLGGLSIEEFEVYTLGSAYCAVALVDDAPVMFHAAHEFREQIRSSLDQDAFNYRLGQVGPSPMHPDFYLICIEEYHYDTPLIKEYDNDLYIFVSNCTQEKARDIYTSILGYIQFPLEQFYSQATTRSLLLDFHTEIESRLRELIENCNSIQSNILGLNFIKYKEILSARKNLLDLHKRHFEFEKIRNSFEREKQVVQRLIEDNNLLSDLSAYFKDHQELEVGFDASFERTVDYLDRSISITDQGQRMLLSAVIGAIIGALITILSQ